MSPMKTPFRVIVIGAGASGLYAAQLLHRQGIHVQILEASDRIGGRIHSLVGFASKPVELGAEFVHGEHSTWYRLVQEAGGHTQALDQATYYHLAGALRSESILQTEAGFKAAWDFIRAATKYQGPDRSVADALLSSSVPSSFFPVVNAFLGNEYGCTNETLSIKGITEEESRWYAGSTNFFISNASTLSLLKYICRDILAKVLLQTPVVEIDYSGKNIQLRDANGTNYQADRIIITVPLSVLQRKKIRFSPPLPKEKEDACQLIGMGPGVKILLRFRERFWPEDMDTLVSDGLIPECWPVRNMQKNDAILAIFAMGASATYLLNSGNNFTKIVLNELDTIFGKHRASATYIDSVVKNWMSEKYILGAYSYPIVGGGLEMRRILANSIDMRIFFAGEATHDAGHSANVHGAIETAERATKALLDSM